MNGTQVKLAEGHAQLEAKAMMDTLMSGKRKDSGALSTAHDGQDHCRAKAAKCVCAALPEGALVE